MAASIIFRSFRSSEERLNSGAAARAALDMALSLAGFWERLRMSCAKRAGSSGSEEMEKPVDSPRETTSHSRGATATMGFPAARMPYILLGTTTPSRPRLMVMLWASAAARTEEILLAGKKGRKRTLGAFAAAASRRGA